MIASVRGTVLRVGPDHAVLEVGGVGLLVQCTPGTAAGLRPGEPAALPTTLVVREESLTLYGFADDDERATFESVQTVSGIGPRIALAMLAALRPEDLRRAVAAGDLATLTTVPGIGAKGAQRLVLELKGKLAPPSGEAPTAAQPAGEGGWADQVRGALQSLGWGPRESDEAVERLRSEVESGALEPEVSVLLRAALRSLDRA